MKVLKTGKSQINICQSTKIQLNTPETSLYFKSFDKCYEKNRNFNFRKKEKNQNFEIGNYVPPERKLPKRQEVLLKKDFSSKICFTDDHKYFSLIIDNDPKYLKKKNVY